MESLTSSFHMNSLLIVLRDRTSSQCLLHVFPRSNDITTSLLMFRPQDSYNFLQLGLSNKLTGQRCTFMPPIIRPVTPSEKLSNYAPNQENSRGYFHRKNHLLPINKATYINQSPFFLKLSVLVWE